MNSSRAALAAGVIALLLSATRAPACETLEACLAQYPQVARGGSGIGKAELDLARAVQGYGAPAVPYLIKLLESDSGPVRTLAGFTLRDIDGLGPEHLDALIRARRNGDGWIPPAIARIGTPQAVEFLVNDLRNEPEPYTQLTGALGMLGAKAAPGLVEYFACVAQCDEKLLRAASLVLGGMREQAMGVAPRLLEIARDRQFTLQARQFAVMTIGYMGRAAESCVPALNELKSDPALASTIDVALTSIGSSDAVPALLSRLPADPDGALAQISSLRKNGYAAGPAVMQYLDDPDWDIRVAAANTLGDIEYGPAEAALTEKLTNEDDWKLVYSALLALGHLKAKGSLDSLRRVRASHWYPPVRGLAAAVIEHIESGAALVEPDGWQYGAIEGSPKSCSSVREKSVPERKRDLRQLAYDGTAPDKIRQIPNVALKVPDGWLVGTDRGEWGGELVHLPARGASQVVYEANIANIVQLDRRLVAVSGIAHMISNSGFLLRIEKDDMERYTAVPWKRLPAAPETSWRIEGSRLLVNTLDGGSVIIDANGGIRMAECRQTQEQ